MVAVAAAAAGVRARGRDGSLGPRSLPHRRHLPGFLPHGEGESLQRSSFEKGREREREGGRRRAGSLFLA